MQVGAGDVAGLAHRADHLPLADLLPRMNKQILHVGVQRLVAVRMQDAQVVAVALPQAGPAHHAVGGRIDRGALGGGQVRPQVEVLAAVGGKGVVPPAVAGGGGKARRQRQGQRKGGLVAFGAGAGGRGAGRLAVGDAGAFGRGGAVRQADRRPGRGLFQVRQPRLDKAYQLPLIAKGVHALLLHCLAEGGAQRGVRRQAQLPGRKHPGQRQRHQDDLRPQHIVFAGFFPRRAPAGGAAGLRRVAGVRYRFGGRILPHAACLLPAGVPALSAQSKVCGRAAAYAGGRQKSIPAGRAESRAPAGMPLPEYFFRRPARRPASACAPPAAFWAWQTAPAP